jgi:hypothetical protein
LTTLSSDVTVMNYGDIRTSAEELGGGTMGRIYRAKCSIDCLKIANATGSEPWALVKQWP